MDPQYDHTKYESGIYNLWEKSGAFKPSSDTTGQKSFSIIMPPPNANDPLHIGHARFVAIEDVLIRYHRMKGDATLWLPGADHAGIETQFVFEKALRKEGKSRFDYDRDTLYKMIWNYVQKNRSNMENQLKLLGASCDWSRSKFTLDSDIVEIVYNTFKKLYDDGLIYRGKKIVNYCPRCGTAFSQLEVISEERDDKLYYLDYGTIKIATTRPETIFADVAIAVNPKDKRYEKLVGKTAIIPLINREIPIIADNLVDVDFGTGALKITPGHDATDFEVGQKHKLQPITVIDSHGKMINTPEKYSGVKALDARTLVVDDLTSAGKIVKTESIKHVVGTCYRDKGIIEPLISEQWFVKVTPLAKSVIEAVKAGQVKFTAKKYEKIAVHWLRNLNDWNISRQIVWGIKIPAWKCNKCDEWIITNGAKPDKCRACGNTTLIQDGDTFDTWFSSSQWPFATLQTKPGDFERFYPTSIMETAYDILPFWVIRMLMMGIYTTKQVPFRQVLIHGLVRDREGQKISKSKGNVIDPIYMTEKYGSDALRMSLIWGALIENDIALSEDNVRAMRNFTNKVWNASRFVSGFTKKADQNPDFDLKIKTIIKDITGLIEKSKLSLALESLYAEFWHWYCDEAIEQAKLGKIGANQLRDGLVVFIHLLHPFMPFVTEAVWSQGFVKTKSDLLISSPWPKV